ncbi:phage portal protein [Microbacterium sp. BR1]|uniref:phage portal protein n=1 Tax=Microbacterium sp. BR1 TaxID=1070896 RepID=UPI000C2B8C24|nr:phage portal protein [Microbacterium sp. BR1]
MVDTSDQFPPAPFDIAFARFRELDAWYSGDATTLAEIYSGTTAAAAPTHTISGRSYRGGVLGSLSKMFIGQPVIPDEKRMRMHLPLAADLCTLSADLLFGEAPQVLFRRPDDAPVAEGELRKDRKRWVHPAQARLDKLISSDEAHAELLLAGEYSAALGGSYLAVAWDADVAEHVFPKAYAADCAIPTFRHGRLHGVKLWSEYHDGNEVFRLVEEHKPGVIEYTLFRGTIRTLGTAVQIEERPETAHYAKLRTAADLDVPEGALPQTVAIGTGTDRLAVTYLKNASPVRDWRKLGVLADLGRSDLDGIQDELDKVDLAWSSLMRDVDNGQGRLVVPEEMLEMSGKPGEGANFDVYRQVFTPVSGSLGKAADGNGPMSIVQFAIRVEEHLGVIKALKREIASAVGYSESHLGLDDARGGQTATEIVADLSDSERTRDKKALYAKGALARWSLAALEIDKAVFRSGELGDLTNMPDVVFAPVSQADPEKLARTAQLLDAARAASRKEIVRTLHSDWDETEIDAEVELIMQEMGTPAPDPAGFTGV